MINGDWVNNIKVGKSRGFIFDHSKKRNLKAFTSDKEGRLKALTSDKEGRLKAFTLVELMVVITIIGILTGISIAAYGRVQRNARDGKRKADLTSIQNALELYYSDNSQYPSSGWDKVKNNSDWQTVGGDDILSQTLEPNYMKLVPVDPKQTYGTVVQGPCGGARYGYVYWSDGADFFLATYSEGTNDGWCGALPGWTACSGNPPSDCYGVQSP